MAKDKLVKVPPHILEIAALKARVSQATMQSQQVVNLLAKYSEGLGRVLQVGKASVDKFAEVEVKHGPCPDEGLATLMAEQRKVLYSMMLKEKADDAEKADAAGEGEPERPADGGVDAPGEGQAPEGTAAPVGAPAEGEAAPQADAPAQPAR